MGSGFLLSIKIDLCRVPRYPFNIINQKYHISHNFPDPLHLYTIRTVSPKGSCMGWPRRPFFDLLILPSIINKNVFCVIANLPLELPFAAVQKAKNLPIAAPLTPPRPIATSHKIGSELLHKKIRLPLPGALPLDPLNVASPLIPVRVKKGPPD